MVRLIILLMSFLLSCGGDKRRLRNRAARIVRSGDERYAERADAEALDQAIQWYLSGHREFPANAKIKGRLTRAYVARAYGHTNDGIDGYATAREFGLDCLKREAAFSGILQSTGGEVTDRAISTLEKNRIGCMTWTSIAWSRWLAERGVVGTSIDLGSTQALARRASDVMGAYDRGRPYAALGLALSIAPNLLKPDRRAARVAFEKAMELGPNRRTVRVDLAEYVSAPQGKTEEWRRLLTGVVNDPVRDDDPDRMENLAAVRRARLLLGQSPVSEN